MSPEQTFQLRLASMQLASTSNPTDLVGKATEIYNYLVQDAIAAEASQVQRRANILAVAQENTQG